MARQLKEFTKISQLVRYITGNLYICTAFSVSRRILIMHAVCPGQRREGLSTIIINVNYLK